jgi:hypothetical protein
MSRCSSATLPRVRLNRRSTIRLLPSYAKDRQSNWQREQLGTLLSLSDDLSFTTHSPNSLVFMMKRPANGWQRIVDSRAELYWTFRRTFHLSIFQNIRKESISSRFSVCRQNSTASNVLDSHSRDVSDGSERNRELTWGYNGDISH